MINSNAIGKMNPLSAPTVTSIFTGCPMAINTVNEINTNNVNTIASFLMING